MLEIGDTVQVKVLDIDRDRQRISLGLKQTQEDPWQRIVDTYNIGDELAGKVTKVVTFGAFVEILDGVEGLVHISELAPHHVENPREIVHPGDEIRVKILEIDSERRRLSLSAKRVEGQVLPVPRARATAGAPGEPRGARREAGAPRRLRQSRRGRDEPPAGGGRPLPEAADAGPRPPRPQPRRAARGRGPPRTARRPTSRRARAERAGGAEPSQSEAAQAAAAEAQPRAAGAPTPQASPRSRATPRRRARRGRG